MANVLWLAAVEAEAKRRGIILGEITNALTGAEAAARLRAQSPDPAHFSNQGDLYEGMVRLRRWAGTPAPTLRDLAQRSTAAGQPVSHATLGRMLGDQKQFPSLRALLGFVLACGLSHRESRRWAAAWYRVSDDDSPLRDVPSHGKIIVGSMTVSLPMHEVREVDYFLNHGPRGKSARLVSVPAA